MKAQASRGGEIGSLNWRQPAQIGKGGLVRDPALHAQVEQRLRNACAGQGLAVHGWFDSPIAGGDGNREFFIHARAA